MCKIFETAWWDGSSQNRGKECNTKDFRLFNEFIEKLFDYLMSLQKRCGKNMKLHRGTIVNKFQYFFKVKQRMCKISETARWGGSSQNHRI